MFKFIIILLIIFIHLGCQKKIMAYFFYAHSGINAKGLLLLEIFSKVAYLLDP